MGDPSRRRRVPTQHIDTEALKRDRRLAEVVEASGSSLRRASNGRLWALCPFHEERTPSFCVDVRSPDEHYHCFGCAAHGDVIDFVMTLENCRFVEACERLQARTWRTQSVRAHRTECVAKVAPRW